MPSPAPSRGQVVPAPVSTPSPLGAWLGVASQGPPTSRTCTHAVSDVVSGLLPESGVLPVTPRGSVLLVPSTQVTARSRSRIRTWFTSSRGSRPNVDLPATRYSSASSRRPLPGRKTEKSDLVGPYDDRNCDTERPADSGSGEFRQVSFNEIKDCRPSNSALLISRRHSAGLTVGGHQRTRGTAELPRVRFLYRFRVSSLCMRLFNSLSFQPKGCQRFCPHFRISALWRLGPSSCPDLGSDRIVGK